MDTYVLWRSKSHFKNHKSHELLRPLDRILFSRITRSEAAQRAQFHWPCSNQIEPVESGSTPCEQVFLPDLSWFWSGSIEAKANLAKLSWADQASRVGDLANQVHEKNVLGEWRKCAWCMSCVCRRVNWPNSWVTRISCACEPREGSKFVVLISLF